MKVEFDLKNLARVLGWLSLTVFWLFFFFTVSSFLEMPGDSGNGMVIIALSVLVFNTPYFLILPAVIFIYGLRKDKGPLWKVFLSFGTGAFAFYILELALFIYFTPM